MENQEKFANYEQKLFQKCTIQHQKNTEKNPMPSNLSNPYPDIPPWPDAWRDFCCAGARVVCTMVYNTVKRHSRKDTPMKEIPLHPLTTSPNRPGGKHGGGHWAARWCCWARTAPRRLDVRCGGRPRGSELPARRWRRRRSSTPLCWRAAVPSDWMPQAASCGISRNAALAF